MTGMPRSTHLALFLLDLLVAAHAAPIVSSSHSEPNPSDLNPEEMDGLYQGDIVLPPGTSARSVASRPMSQRWTKGVVPYEFASNVSLNHTLLIVRMMRAMENLTMVNSKQCITFREKNDMDPAFITIFNGSGCYAPVGSWGNIPGVHGVSLQDSPNATCMVSGLIQHELTHVLGFFHEQSRPDRDTYVSIQWDNIDPADAYNFDKYSTIDADTQMMPYDYGSVMHYGSTDFAINASAPTIIPVFNRSAVIGQRIGLSPIDILGIQRYYGCVPIPSDPNATSTSSSLDHSLQPRWTVCSISLLSVVFLLT